MGQSSPQPSGLCPMRSGMHPPIDDVFVTPIAPTIPTTPPARHPLQRLTADEIHAARTLLDRTGLLSPTVRFAYMGLEEPPKGEVLAFRDRRHDRAPGPGVPARRRDGTHPGRGRLADPRRGRADDRGRPERPVGSRRSCSRSSSRSTRSSRPTPAGVEAMAQRGITDLDLVRPCPLSAGDFDIPGEQGRRMLRVLSFLQNRPEDHCWAHPIDGVVAYVDLIEKRVVQLIDHELLPVPAEEGNFDDPGVHRAGPHDAAATGDHPARRSQLRGRRRRGDLAELAVPGGLRPARGPGAAPDLVHRRWPRTTA